MLVGQKKMQEKIKRQNSSNESHWRLVLASANQCPFALFMVISERKKPFWVKLCSCFHWNKWCLHTERTVGWPSDPVDFRQNQVSLTWSEYRSLSQARRRGVAADSLTILRNRKIGSPSSDFIRDIKRRKTWPLILAVFPKSPLHDVYSGKNDPASIFLLYLWHSVSLHTYAHRHSFQEFTSNKSKTLSFRFLGHKGRTVN